MTRGEERTTFGRGREPAGGKNAPKRRRAPARTEADDAAEAAALQAELRRRFLEQDRGRRER